MEHPSHFPVLVQVAFDSEAGSRVRGLSRKLPNVRSKYPSGQMAIRLGKLGWNPKLQSAVPRHMAPKRNPRHGR